MSVKLNFPPTLNDFYIHSTIFNDRKKMIWKKNIGKIRSPPDIIEIYRRFITTNNIRSDFCAGLSKITPESVLLQ